MFHLLASASLPMVCLGALGPDALDFAIQDVCVDSSDRPVAGDPATCEKHRDLRQGEAVPYLRTDLEGSRRYQALFSYPVTGTDGTLRVITVKAMDQSNLNENFRASWDKHRDGYDLLDASGQYLSFIRTSDGGCLDQKFSVPGGSRSGAWILFDSEAQSGSSNHDIRIDRLDPETTCDLVAEDTTGSTQDTWNAPVDVVFESGKKLQSIITYHFAHKDLARTNNALERFMHTREYGFTRWEAWIPKSRCVEERGDSADCDPLSPLNFLRARCDPSSPIPGTTTFGDQEWVRIDCRDSTAYLPLREPVMPVTEEMARANGLEDIRWPVGHSPVRGRSASWGNVTSDAAASSGTGSWARPTRASPQVV